jgi:hypothetical protein
MSDQQTMTTNSAVATAPPQAANLASIFQKAYARAVALQRMDEQIAAMLEQRQKLEAEFRDAQCEVNAECERMLNSASIAPAKMLAQMAHGGGGAAGNIGPSGIATAPGSAGVGSVATAPGMVDPLTNGNGGRLGFAGLSTGSTVR